MRQEQEKVVVLRRLQSRANNVPVVNLQVTMSDTPYVGLIGGLVVAVVVFLLFVFIL